MNDAYRALQKTYEQAMHRYYADMAKLKDTADENGYLDVVVRVHKNDIEKLRDFVSQCNKTTPEQRSLENTLAAFDMAKRQKPAR